MLNIICIALGVISIYSIYKTVVHYLDEDLAKPRKYAVASMISVFGLMFILVLVLVR